MSDIIPRLPNESWRECVARHARAEGLEKEAVSAFDYEIRHGRNQADAARFVLLIEFGIDLL